MKIIIEQTDNRVLVSVDAGEKGVHRSDVMQVLSLALASTAAEMVPKNASGQRRKKLISEAAVLLSEAVKEDFLKVTAGESCRMASFYNKEAEFMREVLGL